MLDVVLAVDLLVLVLHAVLEASGALSDPGVAHLLELALGGGDEVAGLGEEVSELAK